MCSLGTKESPWLNNGTFYNFLAFECCLHLSSFLALYLRVSIRNELTVQLRQFLPLWQLLHSAQVKELSTLTSSEILSKSWPLLPCKTKFLSFSLLTTTLHRENMLTTKIQQMLKNIITFLSARKTPEHIGKVQFGGSSSTVKAAKQSFK